MFKKVYGSIPHLPGSCVAHGDKYLHEGQANIMTVKARPGDRIIVTEKYDGSCVAVARLSGGLVALTRKGHAAAFSPFRHHHLFAQWVDLPPNYFKFLQEGERVVGEWMVMVHSIAYDVKTPGNPAVWFDVFRADGRRYNYEDALRRIFRSGLRPAKLLHKGDPVLPDALAAATDPDRFFLPRDGAKPEGLVYRCENADNEVEFLAKWVRPGYKPGLHMKEKIFQVTPGELFPYNETI